MNKYRAGGPSKATATTLCQKWSLHQERPYTSRPSRSQQLSNPKLAPKLSATLPPPETKTAAKPDANLKEGESHREIANVQGARPSILLNGSAEGLFHLILPTLFPQYLLVALCLGPAPRLRGETCIVTTDCKDESGELIEDGRLPMTERNPAPKTALEAIKHNLITRLAVVARDLSRLQEELGVEVIALLAEMLTKASGGDHALALRIEDKLFRTQDPQPQLLHRDKLGSEVLVHTLSGWQ
ncbi:hypothetical protein AC578_1930 [Pseudocercospora eumusae]|uniref:Uncharacterized protein n=1 Tax=Pseudocercospora eumusae TaxID=321146 RepID=A0A139HDD0_9PEZI|nr:hypothetical protein AC578_1930 [Pseudocercospora eumusae]